MRLLLVASVAVAIVGCIGNEYDDAHVQMSSVKGEYESDSIRPERLISFDDKFIQSASTQSGIKNKVFANVRSLKAYCVSAHRKATLMEDGSESAAKGILTNLITLFGFKVDTLDSSNTILEYARVMGDLQRLNEEGMGRYLIQYINKAVLCGDGIVTLDRLGVTQMATLSASKLGLEGRPDYFDKLAVPWAHYEHVFWGEDGKVSKKYIKLEEKQVIAASHAVSKSAPLPPKPSSSCPPEGYAVMKLVYARMVEEGCKDFAGKYDVATVEVDGMTFKGQFLGKKFSGSFTNGCNGTAVFGHSEHQTSFTFVNDTGKALWGKPLFETWSQKRYMPPKPETTGFLGCFVDKARGPKRDVPVYVNDLVSKADCEDSCTHAGYRVYALSDNMRCWCGNKYGRYGQASGCDCEGITSNTSGKFKLGHKKNCIYNVTHYTHVAGLPAPPPAPKAVAVKVAVSTEELQMAVGDIGKVNAVPAVPETPAELVGSEVPEAEMMKDATAMQQEFKAAQAKLQKMDM